jgi:hypothetical protein
MKLTFQNSILIILTLIFVGLAIGVDLANAQDNTITDGINEFIDEKLDESKEKVKSSIKEKIKGLFQSISDFFVENVGVNIIEGFKLLGQFFIWLFDSLAKLTRWLVSFV